jgi:two-component system KDP operon response regulator KdpE
MSRAGRVVPNAKLLTAVWGADCREEVEYLRTYVNQLRKKIEDDPSSPLYILTDMYVGYRFVDAETFRDNIASLAAQQNRLEAVEDQAYAQST